MKDDLIRQMELLENRFEKILVTKEVTIWEDFKG